MANVLITASANATPPAGTSVATCTLSDGSEGQLLLLSDLSRGLLGVGAASPLYTHVVNALSASISNTIPVSQSGTWNIANVQNQVSASISNSPSVVVSSGSMVVTNGLSASISGGTVSATQSGTWNIASVQGQVSASISNTLTVGNALSASISGGSVALLAGDNVVGRVRLTDGTDSVAITAGSLLQVDASGATVPVSQSGTWNIANVQNQVSASISNSPSVVVSSGSVVVTNALSASVSGGSVALLAGDNLVGKVRLSASDGAQLGVSAASPLFVSGGGGGTQYQEDTAHTTGDTGTLSLAVRRDANTSLVGDDGDYAPLQVSASGALKVAIVEGGGSGGTAQGDRTGFTDGSGNLTPIGGLFNESASAVGSGSAGAARITAQRALHVNLRDASGNVLGVSGSPLVVTGGAGGTSATDRGTFTEGSGTFTPTGGLFWESAASLTACQSGVNRMTAQRALHVNLRDASGLQLGVSGSPLITSTSAVVTNQVSASVSGGTIAATQSGTWNIANVQNQVSASISNSPSVVVSSGSLVVTNGLSASISNTLTVGNALSASISGGSVALLTGANVIGSASAIQGTAAAITAPWPVKLSDGTDSVAVTAASLLEVSANQTGTWNIANVQNQVSASISNTLTVGNALSASISGGSVALLTGANVIGSASVIQSTPTGIGNAWPVKLTDGTDSVSVTAASLLEVSANQTGTWNIANVQNQISASISNSPSVVVSSGSVVVTNGLSASISGGSVALLAGDNIVGRVRITDGTDAVAITAGSLLQVDASGATVPVSQSGTWNIANVQNQVSASISNSPSVVVSSGSVVVTNGLSASISNTLTVGNALSASISGGSVALLTGANVIGSASAIQGTAAARDAGWPVKLVTTGGSGVGMSGSPMIVALDNGTVAVNGSPLAIVSVDVSASTSGCTIIVSGCAGYQVRVLAITYTTSASQRVGWISGSSASANLQTAMNFATHGGMDVNRGPFGYLWQADSGSAVIITTTTSCYVAGNLTMVRVPG